MTANNMALFQGAALSTKFQPLVQAGVGSDLGEGIRSSYGIVGIKAGRFRIKYKGQEQVLMNAGQPVASIDVVIVKANPYLNKQYYAAKYVDGSNNPPDCYSLDGKVPSAAAPSPQHTSCALCPKNQWGSRIGDNGAKQKACADTKKLAIVPIADIRNQALGGALLFRVPPSSLKDLSSLADGLKGRGYPYNSVVVRIGFDMEVSHPKPTFAAIRPLNDDEAEQVLEMFESDSVAAVLADNDPVIEAEETHAPQPVVAMPMQAPNPPMPPAPPAPVPPVNVAPVPVGAVAVTPFSPAAAPPGPNVFSQPTAQPQPIAAVFAATPVPPGAQEQPQATAAPEPPAAPRPRGRPPKATVQPVAAPVAVQAAAEPVPTASQLDNDISSILAGLSSFGASK